MITIETPRAVPVAEDASAWSARSAYQVMKNWMTKYRFRGVRREEYLIKEFGKLFSEDSPTFYQIQIETCSFCNETCSFCPANMIDDVREKKFMSQEIIDKIIHDLREVGFKGLISLFNNNEPLIDKRLESIIQQCKKELPEAKIQILTNGKLLTFKRFESLYLSGLDSLVIDNYYSDKPVLNRPVVEFVKEYNNSKYRSLTNVKIYMRYKDEVLDSRGGNSPNKQKLMQNLPIKKFCVYPFMQFNVNYLGNVNLCCNDVYYQNIMGDVTANSIKEIWESSAFKDVRRRLLNKTVTMAFARNVIRSISCAEK